MRLSRPLRLPRPWLPLLLLPLVSLTVCCGGGGGQSSPAAPSSEVCGPYPAWRSSAYVLPYPPGKAYRISQGNCSAIGSHQGQARYAYDFAMPVGAAIVAARGGTVVLLDDSHPDVPGPDDNFLRIEHDDGTFATYTHILQGSARFALGDLVRQGERIARSGNSGRTSGFPHLHFQVAPCQQRSVCGTLAVTFRNTDPNPEGLQLNMTYPSLPDPG